MALDPQLREQLLKAFMDPAQFAKTIIGTPMRSYQIEPARIMANSITSGNSRTFSVMMCRQAGKNELSAQLEAYLMTVMQNRSRTIVKVAPTKIPQVQNSIARLSEMFRHPLFKGRWKPELGYIIRMGLVNCIFLSAQKNASVVGATADLLMEFDEAQDIDQDKHDKEFVPMTASTNAPRVYYGTAWDDSTLLERIKQNHLEMTKYDGHPRHFEYNCWRVAEEVPKYGEFVEKEKARLGESHPIFQTQYLLKTISGAGRFLTNDQLALMRGVHPREDGRTHGYYVAGIDVAGADEETQDAALRRLKPRKDSTVMTVARVTFGAIAEISEPLVEVVAHYWWTGRSHRTQYERLLHLLRVRWHVQFAVVDATGVGAGLASFLAEALGESVIEQFAFTGPSKSDIAYELLSAVNAGRLSVYHRPDQDAEAYDEFFEECRLCKYEVKGQQQMSFYVPESDGHDDFVSSLALCARAAATLKPPSELAVIEGSPTQQSRF